MADELDIDGKSFVSSKRAAELTEYAQDYIGQLARAGFIDARKIGGLWYVSLPSLEEYKKDADQFKPEAPRYTPAETADSIVSFEGKDYVSASRAAEISSYNQDYVGQLARSGKILSRQIGNRWYVDREGLLQHKKEKDALLAAVQAESVGIRSSIRPLALSASVLEDSAPGITYTHEERDLIPALTPVAEDEREPAASEPEEVPAESIDEKQEPESRPIPIRVNLETPIPIRKEIDLEPNNQHPPTAMRRPAGHGGRKWLYATAGVATLTIVVVLSMRLFSAQDNAILADNGGSQVAGRSFTAAAVDAGLSVFFALGGALERIVAPELVYKRSE